MRLLILAIRNLTRNKRRTLVTGIAILFGVTAIVMFQGFVNGFITGMIETSVLSKVAPIQIFKKGYIGSDEPLKQTLPQDPQLLARIRAVPGVAAVAPRIDFEGMVSNGSESTVFMATAIDPALEYSVCPKRATHIAAGSRPLGPGDGGNVLIGKTLADALGAKQGTTLVMQSAGPNLSVNALDVTVSGFLPTVFLAESKRMATVTLGFAQDLLRMKGQVTEYVVGVRELDRVDEVAAALRSRLGAGFEVTTWRDVDPGTRDRTKTVHVALVFVALVLFLLVATGIVNTMLMAVYERVREIGTMLALGVHRRQVTAMFIWEAIALGFFSSAVGATIGWALIRVIGRHGVPMRQPGGETTIVHPYVAFGFIGVAVAFAIVGTMLAGLYPAWKASRLQPVEALRAT